MNGRVLQFVSMIVVSGASCVTAQVPTHPVLATTQAATQPATQPAKDIVLARIGDRATITQDDFEKAVMNDPQRGYRMRNTIMLSMVQDCLLELYTQDHPDLVTDAEVDAKVAGEFKQYGFDSIEAFKAAYKEKGVPWSSHRRLVLLGLAQAKLDQRGIDKGADESNLKAIFQARRREFDGTYVKARQIFFAVPVFANPAEKQAVRDKLARMREDILAGRRTWEQCVAESNSAMLNGDMGEFTRHLMRNENIAEAAFKLKKGEMSDIVESIMGCHLIQVTDIVTPNPPWAEIQKNMKRWLEVWEYTGALEEMRQKYPIVGVQPPREPKLPPATQATRPAAGRKPTTHPAGRKPGSLGDQSGSKRKVTTRSATRPAARPYSRPAARPYSRPATRPYSGPAARPTSRPASRPAGGTSK